MSFNGKCKGCGGILQFDPKSQNLVCLNCHSQTKIIKERVLTKKDLSASAFSGLIAKKDVCCNSCGAKVINNDKEITKTCPYCGSVFVLEENEISGLKPDLVIPFKFSKTEVAQIYKKGLKRKSFLPNKFKKTQNINNIHGTYIASFSFDADTNSQYRGIIRKSHTRKLSNGSTETYYTTHNISGNKQISFSNVVVEASTKTKQQEFENIKPFDFNEAVKYNSDFLRGYEVETYDRDLNLSKQMSDDLIKQNIKYQILSSYSYDSIVSFNMTTTFSNYKYAFVLVPVYFINLVYKNKNYITYLNGQTGKLGENLPKSKFKIALTIILPVIIFIFLIIGVYLLT